MPDTDQCATTRVIDLDEPGPLGEPATAVEICQRTAGHDGEHRWTALGEE